MRPAVAGLLAMSLLACGTQEWSFDADAGAHHEGGPRGACSSDSDCALSTLHCDPASGQCVACVDDTQCTTPGLPRCDSALHGCVQCGLDGDCPSGQVCEPTSHRCVSPCGDGGTCPPTAPTCNAHGVCVGCTDSEQCASSMTGHVCDPSSGLCIGCLTDSQCGFERPRCDRTVDQCVRCLTSADCYEQQVCDPATHTCTGGHDD